MRSILAFLLVLAGVFAVPAAAQDVRPPDDAVNVVPDRSATGGAQTLEDILRRQQGLPVDDSARRAATGDPDSAAGIAAQLGTLGGASDADLWRALRYDDAPNVSVSSGGDVAKVLVQDGGMRWYQFRDGPLRTYGGWLLAGTIGALALFLLLRGRIPIEGGPIGRTVLRFRFWERTAHWVLAISFIALGLTGLASLFGRTVLIPLFGAEANASILVVSKWVHNNVAWPFMAALVAVFFLWVWHNIPNRTDWVWIKQAGGIVGSKHPPAKKFNFGQKLIFWSVILLGGSLSVSGLSLLFPFQFSLFAVTFEKLNALGLPGLMGMAPLPEALSPQEEMQLAQAWHAIVSFVLMAIALAHIYIGSIGMQGAHQAMTSGRVDERWAKQHHALWLEELRQKGEAPERRAPGSATPAE
ncbi:formate dehydrogenase subunit gamma [Jannaschia aquimarina]|uniref:FdoI protein n=1 Tax=Jannaschia aquimarina TaxID=935700 RepID=A0A0D1CLP6_9RHOB|nr:formate dehydrogenase subunit gamma [Jannaschia aquimarina]KIT15707.1 Formate dehydrogenase, cytochrome b556(fdo) subunit [Jannaschia aquimarina]SNT38885.1 formate dehydrogenase gamma subunit [Jannaschia aquimarina]